MAEVEDFSPPRQWVDSSPELQGTCSSCQGPCSVGKHMSHEDSRRGDIQTSSPEVLSRTTLPTLSPVTTARQLAETSTLQYQQLEGKTENQCCLPQASEGSGTLVHTLSLTRETTTHCNCDLLPDGLGLSIRMGDGLSAMFCVGD